MDGSVSATLWGTALYTAYGIHAIFDLTKQVNSRRSKASALYSAAVAVLAVTTKQDLFRFQSAPTDDFHDGNLKQATSIQPPSSRFTASHDEATSIPVYGAFAYSPKTIRHAAIWFKHKSIYND